MPTDLLKKALFGERGLEQQLIAEEGVKFVELLLKKNKDYGSSVFRSPVLAPQFNATEALFVRMSDKVARMASLLSGIRTEVTDEALEDTVRDLGAYCLLWLTLQRSDFNVEVSASAACGKLHAPSKSKRANIADTSKRTD